MPNSISRRFEDGTPNFLGILSIIPGFEAIKEVGGIDAVNTHTMIVTHYLYEPNDIVKRRESKLRALYHSNGTPLLRIYGNHDNPAGLQGPIVTVNVCRHFVRVWIEVYPNGSLVSFSEVENAAAKHRIHVGVNADW